jgi:hypothetical protein
VSNWLQARRGSTYDASASNPILTGHRGSAVAANGESGLPGELEIRFAVSIGSQLPCLQRRPGVAEAFFVSLVIHNSVTVCILDITTFGGVAASATIERSLGRNNRLENFTKLAGFKKNFHHSSVLTSVGSAGPYSFRISRCYTFRCCTYPACSRQGYQHPSHREFQLCSFQERPC